MIKTGGESASSVYSFSAVTGGHNELVVCNGISGIISVVTRTEFICDKSLFVNLCSRDECNTPFLIWLFLLHEQSLKMPVQVFWIFTIKYKTVYSGQRNWKTFLNKGKCWHSKDLRVCIKQVILQAQYSIKKARGRGWWCLMSGVEVHGEFGEIM